MLSQTLKDLSVDISFNLELTDFTAPEIDLRLSPKSDASLDRAPAYPKEPRTKPGDIIVLGPHRIVCGDARDAKLMGAMMGGVKADAAVLDLPYNVPIDGFAKRRLRDRAPHAEFALACGEMSSEQFVAFLSHSLKVAVGVSRDGAVHFNFMDWRHGPDLRRAADPLYGELLNLCFWNKSNPGMGCLYRSKHEQVYVYRVGDAKHYNAVELGKNGRNRTNVWDYPSVNTFGGGRDEDRKLHPTIKPIALVADAIKDVTKRGDVVLDTFMGSGTTLLIFSPFGEMSLPVIFGRNVREARLRKGFSQEDLAGEAEMKRSYISDLERGTRNPSLKAIERLATALGVAPEALLRS